MDAEFVANHHFKPLIKYIKTTKRYKPSLNETVVKSRPIMYASHRDACILSYYSMVIGRLLDKLYLDWNLNKEIIAYRALGRANYHFSSEVYKIALHMAPCGILAFDVSKFFDTLDHKLLKERLKRVLGLNKLPEDWFNIFRYITKFHYVDKDDLKSHDRFAASMTAPGSGQIASIKDIKAAGINFHQNPLPHAGIPQGTPISATMANLYMIDFDKSMQEFCQSIGGIYRRYSDDILIICPVEYVDIAESKFSELILLERLAISADKTEKVIFDTTTSKIYGTRSAQYLGFSFYPGGAGIRASSLSRQWRKMRRRVRRTGKIAEERIRAGKADKIWTKSLRRRFLLPQFRNFSSYARNSAKEFGDGEKITHQILRFERSFRRILQEMVDRCTKQNDANCD